MNIFQMSFLGSILISIMLLFHKLFDNKNPDSKFAYTDIVIKNRFNI